MVALTLLYVGGCEPDGSRRGPGLMAAAGGPTCSHVDDRTRTWVLVTDDGAGQNRSALAAVRALALAGHAPAVASSAARSLAASSRHCRRVVAVPTVDEPGWAAAVRAEADRGAYLAVLPTSDAAVVALGAPGRHLVDKAALSALAAAAGMATVPTRSFADRAALVAAAPELDYPVVVKPAVKASRLARAAMATGPAGLRALPLDPGAAVVVQPFLDEPITAVAGVAWRGDLVAAAHQRYERIWPPDCGVASAAVTVDPDPAVEAVVTRLLDGYDGIFQAQFVGGRLVDVNPRVFGSLPLAVAAGANLVATWCDLLLGRAVPRHRARPGVRYRWLEGDLRSIAHRVTSRPGGLRLAMAALAPRAGTAHSVESLGDPRPLLTRLSYVGGRLRP